jgi:hypothetical protein
VLAAANAEDVGKWKWELEQRRDFIFTLSYKQSASINNKTATSELAFLCDQKNRLGVSGTILVPFDGTFESQQDPIPVSIQKKADEFDRSDLLQKWKNGSEFLFSDVTDDVADLIALLKEKAQTQVSSFTSIFQAVSITVNKRRITSLLTLLDL